MDKLEKYINENKQVFDIIPPENIWGEIENALPSPNKFKIREYSFYKYAAVGFFLISGYLGFSLIQLNSPNNFEARLEIIAPEYSEVKTFYNVKMTAGLRRISDEGMKNELLTQLSKLDVLLQDLKKGLEIAPTSKQKEILQRILNIYKQKIKILDLVIAADMTKKQAIKTQL